MKQNIVGLGCIIVTMAGSSKASAQLSTDRNYVSAAVIKQPGITTQAAVNGLTVAGKSTQVAYFDGLGRALQQVVVQAAPGGKDLITPVEYDNYGRAVKKFLPYTDVSGTAYGSFRSTMYADQQSFYTAGNSDLPQDNNPYSQVFMEMSPVSRPLETGEPGVVWQPGTGHAIKQLATVNSADDDVKTWNIGYSTGAVPVLNGVYAAGSLYKQITVDENGKSIVEYKDREGKVLLKKVQLADAPGPSYTGWLCTYFIYDDYNHLRYVVQPKGVEQLIAAGWSFGGTSWGNSSIATSLCFSYEYDDRGRMIIKRLPANTAEVYMVYDARDRLVLSQDGKQRQAGQWLVTQYDAINRPLKTILWTNSTGREVHASAAALSTSYPALSGTYDVLTENYYDNYDWVSATGSGLPSVFASGETSNGFLQASDVSNYAPRSITPVYMVQGLVTGSAVKVLGKVNTYLYSVNFYDDQYRVIQVHSKNIKGGIDIATSQYGFDGKVLVTKMKHQTVGATPGTAVTVVTVNQYDNANRLTSVTKQVNNGSVVTVVQNTYDVLGQLKTKKLGQKKPGGVYSTDPIETLSYNYNIRGWLTGINKDYVNNPAGFPGYFGEVIGYEGGFTTSQYNGNIAGVMWCSRNDQQPRVYAYSYDAAKRLMKAAFTEKMNAGTWNTSLGRDYSMQMGDGSDPVSAYDANGNIINMKHSVAPGTLIDNLTYTYNFAAGNGNRLKSVTDAVNNPASTLGDFKEATSGQAQDYDYDLNGNLVYDNNKSINAISYNYLNLPSSISVTGKGSVSYTYDAAGNKLEKTVADAVNSNTTVTTYIGPFQYENNDLKQLSHEEGRIRRKPDGTYVYDYFVKDHLGNVRVTLTEEETVQEYRMATMELDSAKLEETYYTNLAETRALKPAAYPDRDSTNRYVSKLDGKQRKSGPAILLKVSAGDKINIHAKSWYKHNGKKVFQHSSSLAEQAAGLAGGESGTALLHDNVGAQGAAGTALVPALMQFLQARNGQEISVTRKPRAYLNWILLDEDLKPFKEDTIGNPVHKGEYAGFQQVGEEEKLNLHVKENWQMERSGYVYVFTSNESQDADVIFEDLGITALQGPLLQVDHYYPFGLTIAGISTRAMGMLDNRKGYNGMEHTTDIGLNQYDAFFRVLDPQIGRWCQIDPKAEATLHLSPFMSMENNPILNVDPLGDIVKHERGEGVTRKEFRQMKREIRQMRHNSETFNKVYREFEKSEKVYTYKAENHSNGAATERTDNGYSISIGVHYVDQNQKDLYSSQVATIAHESGHAWRKTHGLDPQMPEDLALNMFDPPDVAQSKIESNSRAIVKYDVASEGGASHIENVIVGELKRSQSSLFDNLNLRSVYPGIAQLSSTPNPYNRFRPIVTAVPGNLNTLAPPRDRAFYLNTKVDIYKENGL